MKFDRVFGFVARTGGAVLCVLALAACATIPDDPDARAAFEEANDPIEPANRWIFGVNMFLDRNAIRPVAKAYRDTVPDDIRDNLRNVLDNANSPVTFLNDVLQGEGGRAAETFVRFFVNSTAGMFGLFDVAGQYGLEAHNEDFGQTLAVWGFGDGAYIMLPVFGPSNVRDTIGRVVNGYSSPAGYLLSNKVSKFASLGTTFVDGTDKRSRNIEILDDIEKNSLDFYATLRSLYRQNRRSEILNGEVDDIPAPEVLEEESRGLPGPAEKNKQQHEKQASPAPTQLKVSAARPPTPKPEPRPATALDRSADARAEPNPSASGDATRRLPSVNWPAGQPGV